MKQRNHCILVVDDEPMIHNLLSMVLLRAGFSVLSAANGEEAVELYRQHSATISAVLLDVLMPPPDGPQTLAALKQINPHVCCCFMSGSTGDHSVEELMALGPDYIFEKPFRSLGELVAKLVEIVDVETS